MIPTFYELDQTFSEDLLKQRLKFGSHARSHYDGQRFLRLDA